jgi:hypothetical protein
VDYPIQAEPGEDKPSQVPIFPEFGEKVGGKGGGTKFGRKGGIPFGGAKGGKPPGGRNGAGVLACTVQKMELSLR